MDVPFQVKDLTRINCKRKSICLTGLTAFVKVLRIRGACVLIPVLFLIGCGQAGTPRLNDLAGLSERPARLLAVDARLQ